MKLKPLQNAPFWLCAFALALVLGLERLSGNYPHFDIFQRLESLTYDWRLREAARFPAEVSDRLGFVHISDETIALLSAGKLGTNHQFGLYWPRHVYGQVLRELRTQGASVVGLDVLFGERRHDHDRWLLMDEGQPVTSDQFLKNQLERSGNVVLGASPELPPIKEFRAAAAELGDITIELDGDGVLRRARAYRDYRIWHEALRLEAQLNNWNLAAAEIQSNAVLIPCPDGRHLSIPVEDGFFDPGKLPDAARTQRAKVLQPVVEEVRVWHLGIVLAARALKLDLEEAEVKPEAGTITLRGANGLVRVLPIDQYGHLLIDWAVPVNHPKLTQDSFESLLARDILRQDGTNAPGRYREKVVVIGSTASGNELSDRGATPLEKNGFLTSNHWNVANSVLTGRFIRTTPLWAKVALACIMAALGAASTWRPRPLVASAIIIVLAAALGSLATWAYVRHRVWIPLVAPGSALLLTHVALLGYRVFFESSERRRVRGLFSKMVSPDVVQELLATPELRLGGARREMSIFFADVRGFTEFIDAQQAKAEEEVQRRQLLGAEATACIDRQAEEVLQTVNLYLGTIAETVKKHGGTLDKYIGDCVMAFWGAPGANQCHALAAVQAAIEAQQTINALNERRHAENLKREAENPARLARGEPPLPPLTLLTVGTGINTGITTVGLMGSDAHLLSYTVFGREVNLASRLEAVSGRGRIVIGENTWTALKCLAPNLAAKCLDLPAVTVKGFRAPVKVYEVPWRGSEPMHSSPAVREAGVEGASSRPGPLSSAA